MIKTIFFHLVISIILTSILGNLVDKFDLQTTNISSVIGNFLQIVAGLMGFLLAAIALLFNYNDTPQIKRLKMSIKFSDIYNSYFYAIYVCGAITISGIVLETLKLDSLDLRWLIFSLTISTLSLSYLIGLTRRIMLLTK